jgi:hypothetical protein
MKFIAMVLLLAASPAAADVPATQPVKDAFFRLRCTDCFTSAYVGPEMVVSTDVKALNVILDQPDARNLLLTLQRTASPEGQLYAMCGLYVVDRAVFDALLPQYQSRHGAVQTLEGCVVGDAQIARVFNECVASGAYPTLFRKVRGQQRLVHVPGADAGGAGIVD